MKEPWSIKSRAKECAISGTPFQADQRIRAAIFPDPESSGYLRRDYTIEAWENRKESEHPFSTWITVYQPPVIEEKAEDVVDDDPESLLKRMVEEDEEHTENTRYILAVMLERQKLLRETDTQEIPSGILRIYEHRKTGDVFIIKDPGIALSEVDQIQEEIRALLDPQAKTEPVEVIGETDQQAVTSDEDENALTPSSSPENDSDQASDDTQENQEQPES